MVYLVNVDMESFTLYTIHYKRKGNKWLIPINEWVQKHGGGTIIPFSVEWEQGLWEVKDDPVAKQAYLDEVPGLKSGTCIYITRHAITYITYIIYIYIYIYYMSIDVVDAPKVREVMCYIIIRGFAMLYVKVLNCFVRTSCHFDDSFRRFDLQQLLLETMPLFKTCYNHGTMTATISEKSF